MSLRAKDHKDVRGAYKERQRALYQKDSRKGKTEILPKPWKETKGYGTRSGRECYLGRNYGCRLDQRRSFAWMEGEAELEDVPECEKEGEAEEYEYDMQTIQESSYDVDTESAPTHLTEEESYELQLAQALSLSLLTSEASPNDESGADIPDEDTDGYTFMGTDVETMDTDTESGHETDASGETEWVEVDRFSASWERPTYAQMTKVEVT